jgi:hypothetical protein
VGALEVTFVPAHHWSRRGLFDHCATLWGALSSPWRVACGCTSSGTAPTARSSPRSDPSVRDRRRDAAHRRVCAALVHADHAHGPGGGRACGLRRRGSGDGADALGHVLTLPRTSARTHQPHPGRLSCRGPGSQESVGSRGTGEPPALSTPACFLPDRTSAKRSFRRFVPILRLLLIVMPRIR